MDSEAVSIGELADAAGLTRRAIRFYVQQKLLPPPTGRGRGNHYNAGHLARLRRVVALQQGGHSLEAIRQVLAREPADVPQADRSNGLGGQGHPSMRVRSSGDEPEEAIRPSEAVGIAKPQAAGLSARLWTRLALADGIELSYDATRFNPTIEQLLRVRQVVRQALLERE